MRVAYFTETFLPKIDGIVTRLVRTLEQLALLGHEALIFAPHDPPKAYAGHRVVNVNYDLYLVRGGPTMDTARLYESGWDVGLFHGGHRVDPHHPGLTGARVSLWPDSGAAQTELSVEEEVFLPLRYIAQMTWTGERGLASYAEFEAVAAAPDDAAARARLEDELGDLLFVAANLARHAGVDVGAALRRANHKFERRFRAMEGLASDAGTPFDALDLAAQEALWQQVKEAAQ